MRLFFAIALPEDVRRALSSLEADLGTARWVPDPRLHLTLRFIGELEEARVVRLVEHTTAVCGGWPVPTLRLWSVGVFGSPSRPRVLWTGVEPVEEVRAIAASIDDCAARIGVGPDRRPFEPHVTLARFERGRADRVRAFLAAHASFASEPFVVDEVILYRSTIRPGGPVYEPLARFSPRRAEADTKKRPA